MTAASSKTTLVLLLVQWRKVLKRLGCLLNQGENSARGFWILCECAVWRPSEIETRGFFRAGHPLAGPVCCVCWGCEGSSFLGRARRMPCQRELCSLLLGIIHSEVPSPAPCWVQMLCAGSGLLCGPCTASVEIGSCGWGICEASQPLVKAAAPSAVMGLSEEKVKNNFGQFLQESDCATEIFDPSSDKVWQNYFH